MIKVIGNGQQAELIKHYLPYVCDGDYYHIAIGNPLIRKRIVETELPEDARLFNISAEGSLSAPAHFVGHRVHISPQGVEIGFCTYLNTGCIIEHDCTLGDYVNINPGAVLCGAVKVGDCTTIGAGAVIKEGVKIGSNCIVGAGTVVIRDIPDDETWVGNPARKI